MLTRRPRMMSWRTPAPAAWRAADRVLNFSKPLTHALRPRLHPRYPLTPRAMSHVQNYYPLEYRTPPLPLVALIGSVDYHRDFADFFVHQLRPPLVTLHGAAELTEQFVARHFGAYGAACLPACSLEGQEGHRRRTGGGQEGYRRGTGAWAPLLSACRQPSTLGLGKHMQQGGAMRNSRGSGCARNVRCLRHRAWLAGHRRGMGRGVA